MQINTPLTGTSTTAAQQTTGTTPTSPTQSVPATPTGGDGFEVLRGSSSSSSSLVGANSGNTPTTGTATSDFYSEIGQVLRLAAAKERAYQEAKAAAMKTMSQ
jgi:hypothetical protein